MALQLTQKVGNGKTSQNPLSAGKLKVQAVNGAHFEVVDSVTGKTPLNIVVKKVGDNALLLIDDIEVEIEGFYAQGASSEIALVPLEGAPEVITPASTPLAQLADGSSVIHGLDALPATAAGPLAAPLLGGMAGPVAGGAAVAGAAAAGGGGGGGGSTVSGGETIVSSIISGTIHAGPVVSGNGLTVNLYKADGTTLLGSGTLDATGKFSIDVGSYSGVVIAKVVDANTGADYIDEATGQAVDLNGNLMAVGVASGGSVTLNINPLTSVAAMKAGANYAGATTGTLTADAVNQTNSAVAQAFGLSDLTGTDVVTTVAANGGANAAYTPGDGLSNAEKYGAVLAALSGMDSNGGGTQNTINTLVTNLTVAGATGTLNPTGIDAVIAGAASAAGNTYGTGADSLVSGISNTLAKTSASVGINAIATDNAINTSEASGVVTITGTTVAGATVSLAIGGNTRAATVSGTTWSYALQAADYTAMGQGGETITATASLSGGGTATATRIINVDTVAPTLAITSNVTAVKSGETATVTFTFSETPSDFVAGDIVTTGGNLTGLTVTGDPKVYTATFTPTPGTASGNASITVASGTYTDAAGNNGGSGTTPAISIDTLAPTLAITSNVAAVKSGETATVTFTFSEAPTGFNAGDVVTTGGNLTGLAVTSDPKVYTATFTPTSSTASGNASITVASGTYSDAAGNNGGNGTTPVLSIDTLAPTLAITSDVAAVKSGETATITFTFSEDPGASFTWDGSSGDVVVSGGTLDAISGTGLTRTATFTPTPGTASGNASITVASGTYTDAAGNNGGNGTTPAISIDTLAPTLAITSDVAAVKAGETATVTFTFSEDPTGFDAGDVVTSGGALTGLAVTGNPKVYTALFTPTADIEGTAGITVTSGAYTDAAGNSGGNGSTPAISIDTLAPTLAITSNVAAVKSGETATVTFSFSEAPTGFVAGDVVTSGGVLTGLAMTGDPKVYTATFTPTPGTASGNASITVAADTYSDAAGNNGGNGTTPALSIDTLAPSTTSVDAPASGTYGAGATPDHLTFSVHFSEAVAINGANPTLSLTIGTNSRTATYDSGTGTDTLVFKYLVTNTDASNGTLTVDAFTGSLNDLAGNAISAPTLNSIGSTAAVVVDGATVGSGIDGYLSGVTIFADNDSSGSLTAGDSVAITDSTGGFKLYGASGPLVMYGGSDISTGLAFNVQYEAPTGYSVINPVSTLIRAVQQDGSLTNDAAYEVVREAIYGATGGPSAAAIMAYDPFQVATNSGSSAQQIADAIAYQRVAAALATLVDIASEAMFALGVQDAGNNLLDQRQDSILVFDALAARVADPSYPAGNLWTDLKDGNAGGFVATLIGELTTGTNPTPPQIDDIVSFINTAMTTIEAAGNSSDSAIQQLTDITKVQVVAQGNAAQDLADYLNGTNSTFDNSNFQNNVDNANVGVIVPVQFAIAADAGNAAVLEGQNGETNLLSFTVTRSGNTEVAATVNYQVVGGSQLNGTDFAGGVIPSGELAFTAGETSKTINITLAGNDVRQGDRPFMVSLVDNSGAAQIPTPNAFATIKDDDPFTPVIYLNGTADVAAGQATGVTAVVDYYDPTATLSVTVGTTNASASGAGTSGTLAQVNAWLAGLTLNGSAGTTQGNLEIAVSVAGRTGYGNSLLTIHNAPTQDLPTNLAVTAGVATAVTGLAVHDVDGGNLTVTLSATHGTLNLGDNSNVAVIGVSGGLQLTGAVSDLNAALQTLSYTGAPGQSSGVISMTSSDGDALTGNAGGSFNVSIAAAAPTLTLPGMAASVTVGVASAVTGLAVADSDSAILSVTLNAGNGTLQAVANGAALITGNNGATMNITGATADVNATLAGLHFTANGASPSLTVSVNDGDATTSDPTNVAVGLAVVNNTAPSAGGNLTTTGVTEDTPTTLHLTGFTLADTDGTAPHAIRVLSVSGGSLLDAGGNAIVLGGAGSVLNLTGGAVDVQFTPSANRDVAASISYVVVDPLVNSLNSAASTITVPITAVNDAPVVSPSSGAITYAENGTGMKVAATLTIADVDSPQMSGATVTISNLQTGDILAAGALPAGIGASYNAGTGVMTLSGTASRADYETALRLVTYSNGSDDPSTTPRNLSIAVTDVAVGGTTQASSAPVTRTVNVIAVNDAPVLAGLPGTALSYTENAAPQAIGATLSITDPDSTTLSGAIVAITAGYRPGEDILAAGSLPGGISASFNASTGRLTLSGTASVADYQTALRAVTYANSSDNPSSNARTISFIAADDQGLPSAIASRSISITPTPDKPVVDLNGLLAAGNDNAISFVKALYPNGIAIAPNAAISDVDSTQLSKLTVTLTDAQAGDSLVLSASAQAVATSAGIVVSNSGNVLTLTGDIALANYNNVLKGVLFKSSSNAVGTDRHIDVVATDITGALLVSDTAHVTVGQSASAFATIAASSQILTLTGNPGSDAVRVDLPAMTVSTTAGNLAVAGDPIFTAVNVDASGVTGAGVTVIGNTGSNTITGSAGNDILIGGGGSDIISGGFGNDRITYQTGSTLDGGGDIDTLVVSGNFDLSTPGATLSNFEVIDASGAAAGVTLTGDGNAQTLIGSTFNDTLKGGGGNDILFGGLGKDIFDVSDTGASTGTAVTIADLELGDSIRLGAAPTVWDVQSISGSNYLVFDGKYVNLGATLPSNPSGWALNGDMLSVVKVPTQTVSITAMTRDSGASATDFITNDGAARVVSGTISATLGANEVVKVSFDGGSTWASASTSGTGWTIADAATHNADWSIQARVVNSDANVNGATATRSVTFDNQAITLGLALSNDTGASDSDRITRDAAITVTGQEAGATVQYSGNGTVWGNSLPTPAQGANTVYARQIDVAGNTSATSSLSFNYDTSTPATPTGPTLAVASDSGTLGDRLTNVTTPTVTGTAEANATITLKEGTTVLGTTTAAANGSWSITSAPLAEGAHTLNATATDAAGNVSDAATLVLNIDSVIPTLAITSDIAAVKSGETATVTFTFSEAPIGFDASDVVTTGGTLGAISGTGLTRTATFTPTPGTASGNASITVASGTYSDAAGNNGGNGTTPVISIDTQAPTLVITSNVNAVKSGETATITFTFSEAPTGFDASDVITTGGTLGAISGTGLTHTATFTPTPGTASDNASITVASGTYADAAGNNGGNGTTPVISIDTLAPTVSGVSDNVPGTVNAATANVAYTYTFSEAVTGLAADDFTVSNGTISSITGGGTTWTVNVTPAAGVAGGNITLALAQGAVNDAAGNPNAASSEATQAIDTLAPTVSVSDNVPGSANAATANVAYTYTFSEAVTGLAADDFTVSNGTISSITGGGTTWTVNVTPAAGVAGGNITLALAQGAVNDAAGNPNAASTENSQAIDTRAPAAPAITGYTTDTGTPGDFITADTQPTFSGTAENNATVNLTITKDGSAFVTTSVVANASGNWIFQPAATLADGVYAMTATATDTAGNTGSASTTATLTIDHTAPAAPAITGYTPDTGVQGDFITANTQPTFSGTAENNATVNLAITKDGSAFVTTSVVANASGNWIFQPAATLADGVYAMTATATDTAGNTGSASTTATLTIDHTAPAVSGISDNVPGTVNAATANVAYTYTFSEAVTGLAADDFTISNGTIASITGGGTTWTVNVTPAAGVASGNISLALAQGAVMDAAGNPNAASTEATQALDTLAPTVSGVSDNVPGSANAATANVAYTYTFSEAVTGLAADDFTVSNGTISSITGGGTTWTVNVTPAAGVASGNISLALAAGAVVDAAGNPNAASSQNSQAIDTLAPTVSVSDDVPGSANAATANVAYTYTFSEAVTGLAADDFTVSNGSISSVTGGGTTWTVNVTPAAGVASGNISLALAAGAVVDAVGNPNAASSQNSQAIDTVAPSITVASDDLALKNGDVAHLTFTLSEAATDFTAADVSVAGGTLSNFAGSGASYTADFTATPGSTTDATVSVHASQFNDAAGNANTASNTVTMTVDTVAPTATATITGADDNVAPDTGNVANGGTSNDATLSLSGDITGTLGGGEVVAIYDGATRLGTALVSSATWSYATPSLSNASHAFTAVVEDAAGNLGTPSAVYQVTVNAVVPTATASLDHVVDNVPLYTGEIANGGRSNDTTLDLSGTVAGTLAGGEQVAIYDGANRLGYAAISGSDWSYTTAALSETGHSFTAVVENAVGTQGTASAARTVTVDATPPAAPTVTPQDSTVVTYDGADYYNNGQFNVGGLEANATWQYILGSGANWTDGNGTSFTPPDGTYGAEVQVRQIDLAGNASPPDINDGTVIVDTHAPAAPTLALVADTGASNSDGITSNGQVSVSGLEAGATWEYSTDGGSNWSNGTGNSLTVTGDGAKSVIARQTDLAGNASANSSALGFTLDATAPTTNVSEVNGATLTIHYDETLDSANPPAASDFAVGVNGSARAVSGVVVSGSDVILTLASAVVHGDTLTLDYSDPSANDDAGAIQDIAGNDAASSPASNGGPGVVGWVVDNRTPAVEDTTAPVLQTATVNGNLITLTYNEALDPAHQPSASYFLVAVNTLNRVVDNLAISGNSVSLTLRAPVSQGDTVTLSYSDPSGGNDLFAIQDTAGNDALALSGHSLANGTVGNAGSTHVVRATFTETGNASVTYTFNEAMQASSASNLVMLKNGTGSNILTGISGIDGGAVTFTTNATLGATDYVVATYRGGGDLRDLSGNTVGQNTLVIGGSGVSNIDLSNIDWSLYTTPITIRGNAGDDLITGSGSNDVLFGNAGSDTLNGGWGADTLMLTDGATRASDTVVIGTDGGTSSGSQPFFHDTVVGFDVSGSTTNDQLNLPSNTIAASTAGFVNGTDAGVIKSHSIGSGGIVTFGSADTGTDILINAGNLNDATAYLELNFTTPGQAVAFNYDSDGNGQADSLFVFQDLGGTDIDNDALIKLTGVTGVTLGTTAGQNVVQLVDTTGPDISGASMSTGANASFSLSYFEPIQVTASHGADGWTALQNGMGSNIITDAGFGAASGTNTLTFQTNANLASGDYLYLTYDSANGTVRDLTGNPANSILPGFALGGSGNTTINLSTLGTAGYGIYDLGGNDLITGSAGDDDIDAGDGNDDIDAGAGDDYIQGGTGADTLDGGAGADEFSFTQGDSTVVSFSSGVYTFADGVADIITGGFDVVATNNDSQSGDHIHLRSAMPGNGLSLMSTPAGGQATDQSYFLERGDYSNGAFTLNAGGADTLVVYDGNSETGAVSQTALVLQGVLPTQLTATNWGDIYLSSAAAPVNQAPIITSNGSGATATINVAENTTAVTTVAASDADGGALIYSLNGGVDAAKFSINPTTGELTFNSAPDFEVRADVGADNVYDVTVQVSDGLNTDTQAIAVTVTDVVEGGDTTAPISTGASFTNGANSVITLTFNEAVTATTLAGLGLTYNHSAANNWQGVSINVTGTPSGLGTTSITIPTSTTLGENDVVRLRYNAAQGNQVDLAGNPLPSADVWIGGSGATTIDLGGWWADNFNSPVTLRGNGGADILIATLNDDLLVDGGGADILAGGPGADVYRLVENGTTIPYSRDVVSIGLGESIVGTEDVILGSLTSPTGTGFDITSADPANHDALNLLSNTIAANVSHFDGFDAGIYLKHSISNGIITFEDLSGNAIGLNNLTTNWNDVMAYLAANINLPGTTVGFKVDSDNDGTVDSLGIFQDAGTIPLLGGLVLSDTLIKLSNLIGIDNAILSTTAGANAVQIVDTQAPNPVGFEVTNDGMALNFLENVWAPTTESNLELTLHKNGTDLMTINGIDGNGTASLTIHTNQTLTADEWVLLDYNGTDATNGLRDASNNVSTDDSDASYGGSAEGSAGNNNIDLSGVAFVGKHYDLNGAAGNDTLVGNNGNDWINGGADADTMTGGEGRDEFGFEQGDSPVVTARNLGSDNVLNTGDTFSFANGVDRVTDFSSGDGISLNKPMSDLLGDAGAPTWMGSAPTDGRVTDQGFFAVQGNYAEDGSAGSNGVFNVDTTNGADTLVVWDGDSSADVTQTGIVLSGVTLAQLSLYTGSNWISHV